MLSHRTFVYLKMLSLCPRSKGMLHLIYEHTQIVSRTQPELEDHSLGDTAIF